MSVGNKFECTNLKVATNNYELYYCTLKCSEFCAALATADASAVYLIKYKET